MGTALRDLADQHNLLIGGCFNPHAFEHDPAYGETMGREFNCLVAENIMKMHCTQPEQGQFDFGPADAMLDFAEAHSMRVRGHTCVWHNGLPEWVTGKEFTATEALDILRQHIFTVMDHFKGRVFAWDVVNEAFADAGGYREDSPWQNVIGPEYLETVFGWAHEADPDTMLFYNDYGMEQANAKADSCYDWVRAMLDANVPVQGIGLQYHKKLAECPDTAEVAANVKRFQELGLTVHITELDIWLPTDAGEEALQAQADAYADIFRLALDTGIPAVLLWGLTDKYSWISRFTEKKFGRALIFDEEFKPKPAYEAITKVLT